MIAGLTCVTSHRKSKTHNLVGQFFAIAVSTAAAARKGVPSNENTFFMRQERVIVTLSFYISGQHQIQKSEQAFTGYSQNRFKV
jgi:hypothetical protein